MQTKVNTLAAAPHSFPELLDRLIALIAASVWLAFSGALPVQAASPADRDKADDKRHTKPERLEQIEVDESPTEVGAGEIQPVFIPIG